MTAASVARASFSVLRGYHGASSCLCWIIYIYLWNQLIFTYHSMLNYISMSSVTCQTAISSTEDDCCCG